MKQLVELYETLNKRKRPEDIAEMILPILGNRLSSLEASILNKAAKRSLKKQWWMGYTSMSQEFPEAQLPEKQMLKALELFQQENVTSAHLSIEEIEDGIERLSPLIHKKVGDNNFVGDRLNKEQREAMGMDVSKRMYNKRWRIMKKLEKKLQKYYAEERKVEFQKIAKHGLIHQLSFEDFSRDINSACFIAYYTARSNMRSVFTNESQTRPFDEICEMLLNRCKGNRMTSRTMWNTVRYEKSNPSANWLAIAQCYTSKEVIDLLSENEKGLLLGKWTNTLEELSHLLRELWAENSINRSSMVVKRGNDSSTWNNMAGAWNKARDQWMSIIHSMGMSRILDEICFGKVMRLMAADVVYWHTATGGKLDPNTAVWNKIPLPWEVFSGNVKCNQNMVQQACHEVGLDPIRSGWIAPKKHGVAAYTPTPELVHGVEVSNPFLASVLKQQKYYSGKS